MSSFFKRKRLSDGTSNRDVVKLDNLTIKNNTNNTISIFKEVKEVKEIKEEKKANNDRNERSVKKIKILNNKTTEKKQDSNENLYNDLLLNNYQNFKETDLPIDDDLKDQIKSIGSIEFTLLPNEEVKRISVCEVNTTKWEGENSLFDQRMGIQDKNNTCETCGEQWKVCPGHFGHIELLQPIPHPIQIKLILKYLQVYCRQCYKLILTPDRMKILDISKYKREARLDAINDESEKIMVCPHCSTAVPKFFNNEDSYFMKFSKTEQKPYKMSYAEICKIFNNITLEDFFELGFDDERLHPKNLIIQNLLVLPPCARPFYLNGEESCHDDLTYKYIDIIKVNNKIQETTVETTKNTLVDALYFHIKTLFDNSKGKSRESINKRPIKCIKSRLKGKTGQIRNNLQGKRCDFNGRSVITAEANCMADEIVIPSDFAKKLTYPVNVNSLNLKECQHLLDTDKVVSIIRGSKRYETSFACHTRGFELKEDDVIKRWDDVNNRFINITVWIYEHSKGKKPELHEGDIVIRDGTEHKDIVPSKRKPFELKCGDVIVRYIKDGDLVVLNRQPTLWKGSMRAKKVKIRPGKTIRFALSSTAAYNADFDGDEMNIFPAQSEQTRAECADILSTEANFMSGQDSKPMLSIKQDGMTGGYKLTYGRVSIKKHSFMDCVSLEQWDTSFIINKMEHIKKVHKWTGMLDEEIKRIKQEKLAEFDSKKLDLQNTLNRLRTERENSDNKKTKSELKKEIENIKNQLSNLIEPELDLQAIENEAEEILLYTGHSLFSMLLPDNFEYSCINGMSPDGKPVRVTQGVLVSGSLNKKAMGNSSGSLMHHIAKDYGNRRAIEFVSFYQILINNWLMVNGFSIGIADCLTKNTDEIERSINKCLLEANAIMQTEKDADILEAKLMGILNKARDIGQIQANKALEPDNNLVAMIRSGAKGNDFNIAQITGLVGQQAVSGNRIPKTFGSRTLPHFVKTSILSDAPDVIPQTLEDHNSDGVILRLAESRGFVKNSYFKGLSPAEFFFHAAGGREGLIDSAIKTADTGYIQRKITKMVEDLKISYTGTIVNHRNNILEFAYGSDNMDATKLIDTGKENYTFIDIAHTVECLNRNLEWNNYLETITE